MRIVFERRASVLLFNLARSNTSGGRIFLLPANICPAVPLALAAAARGFEFVDIDPVSLCIDWQGVRKRLLARGGAPVAALVYVRTYGADSDASQFFREVNALDKNVCLIDDRCLSPPESEPEQVDWQGADVVVFSTGYAKYVDLGFGGFAHLRPEVPYFRYRREYNPRDAARVEAFCKSVKCSPETVPGDLALLSRLHWLDMTRPQLPWAEYAERIGTGLPLSTAVKKRHNAIYRRVIPRFAQMQQEFHRWRFQIRVEEKQTLLKRIFEAGLFASDHYFPSSRLFGGVHACPVAEKLHQGVVNLFNDSYVNDSQVQRLAEIVRRHVNRTSGIPNQTIPAM